MSDTAQHVGKKKLIEVSLPLQKINEESAREKSIRHGHPSTLHLWWSRKPLATARAVLFAQLVDDPSSRPDLYPTREDQALERKKLHELIERLVVWENSNDEALLAEVRQKIMESTDGNPPPILDPFAGGGSIPLEAQRLGLKAHASDLNPVAVLINKALIEIPPKFAGQPPVFPGAADEKIQDWPRATGLAEDVRRYGQWMRDEAEKRIGHLYPKATLQDGAKAPVIAWIWARTVRCPNPECSIHTPLARSWWLGKKVGNEAYVIPRVEDDAVQFEIGRDPANGPTGAEDGTVRRTGATCIRCGAAVDRDHIKAEGRAGDLGVRLVAMVADGGRSRVYIPATLDHEEAGIVASPIDVPSQKLAFHPKDVWTPPYGLDTFSSLFTNRQLNSAVAFSDLVGEARDLVIRDLNSANLLKGAPVGSNISDVQGYADAVATYLGLGFSGTLDICNSLATWSNSRNQTRNLFARQAIPMSWEFVEASPFGRASGDIGIALESIASSLDKLPSGPPGTVLQQSAGSTDFSSFCVSTDPPYYDNIGYSDLSDFFYVWLRRALKMVHPSILSTMLVPKSEELVANPYRHGGKSGAQSFFEEGFEAVFRAARSSASKDLPITVYYAFKQQDATSDGSASTGWETLLEGMIRSGWQISATWPMRSERGGRMTSIGTNALASSIVLACRPRPENAPRTDRRGFIQALKAELPQELHELQQGAIAPVDVPQAVIGPGMAVFSRYSAVLEDDGSKMTVRTALQRINAILDEVLTELENDFDKETRFALTWFRQSGFDTGRFGDAESVANARGVNLDALQRAGILTTGGGKVALIAPSNMPADYDPATDTAVSQWEVVMHLTRVLADEGVPAAATLLGRVPTSVDWDLCKELASLLFKLAEDMKKTKLAVDFNNLGAAWNDIARQAPESSYQPSLLD
jgi:putative DNA methylase